MNKKLFQPIYYRETKVRFRKKQHANAPPQARLCMDSGVEVVRVVVWMPCWCHWVDTFGCCLRVDVLSTMARLYSSVHVVDLDFVMFM